MPEDKKKESDESTGKEEILTKRFSGQKRNGGSGTRFSGINSRHSFRNRKPRGRAGQKRARSVSRLSRVPGL